MIRRFLSMRIRGYSVRRWFPTVLVLSLILTHAVASPFWYRIAAGTRITQTEIVPSSDMRRAFGFTAINDYDDDGASHIAVRRLIQRAIDAEYAGQSRAEARGVITLPVPTVFLELPDLQSEDRGVLGHRFRCDYRREECSMMLQSSAYFVHIMQGQNFVSRLLIDRPLLAVRAKDQGVQLTGLRFPKPEIWRSGVARSIERFPTSKTRLAITDGPVLNQNMFNHTHYRLSQFNDGTVVSLPPFVPIDLDYTLDFSEPSTNFLVSCRVFSGVDENSATSDLASEDPCSFETDEISTFTLSQCDATKGPCPSRTTDPLDDLKNQEFVKSGLTERMSLGFLDDETRTLFRIANRAGGTDISAGLVDLPNRTKIVEEIIIDYLTVFGFSEHSAEFEKLLTANPDLDIGTVRATFQQVSPPLINRSMGIALERQPQLWVWHGYAEYIGPEILDGLARDLVKMGLARPY